MDEKKDVFKEVLRVIGKKALLIILLIIIVFVFFASALYYLFVDDGKYKEGDWSNTNFGASQYINNVTVEADGTISNGMTIQEIWDKMMENECKVNQYLDSPEELARLMMAEIVTKYPDTRKNPDKKIDWDKMNWKKLVNNEMEDEYTDEISGIQGIVKLKRADENNNIKTMTYASEEEFNGYIEEYNNSGSEKAKENALSHFTLKKVATSGNSDGSNTGVNYTGPYLCWPVDSTTITSPAGLRNKPTEGASKAHKGTDIGAPEGADVYAAEAGKIVLVDYNSARGNYVDVDHGNGYKTRYQHLSATKVNVGDIVKKGQVIAAVGSTGISTGAHLHFEVLHDDKNLDPEDFKYQNGMGEGTGGFGSTYDSENTSNTSTSNSTIQTGNVTTTTQTGNTSIRKVDGDGYTQEYTSSAGITYKEYRQNRGSYKEHEYWTGTIRTDGCGPTALSIIASGITNNNYTPKDIADMMTNKYSYDMYTSYLRLKEIAESIGLKAEAIEAPSKEQVEDSLKNGKVIIMSTHNRLFTSGNHFIALLDIDTEGNVYVSNPNKNTTTGWQSLDAVMSGRDNIVTIEAGASGIANANSSNSNLNKSSTYVAMVASWWSQETIIETNDPNVKNSDNTEYRMTTTPVDYQQLVQQYNMPFDLLWAFLIIGDEKDFVFELADLVYNSDIVVTIYDNLNIQTDVDTWNYTKRTKAVVDATVTGNFSDIKKSQVGVRHVHDPYKEEQYKTVKTVITSTNTINSVLTKANTWIADYENEYTYVEPKTTEGEGQVITKEDQEYSSEPTSSGGGPCRPFGGECEAISNAKNMVINFVISEYEETFKGIAGAETISSGKVAVHVIYNTFELYEKYVNISDTVTQSTKMYNYIAGTPELKEKTDPQSEEPNFVTIFRKKEHIKNKRNTISVASWLFEIIEQNESTANLLDIVKYLLQKAIGKDGLYGITDDFETLWSKRLESFSNISGGTSGIDGIPGQIYDILLSKGVPPVGAAAIMGNIQGECDFDPADVNEIGASGLIQWTEQRLTRLKNLAASRGVDWTDVDTQIEFMWQELNESYTKVRDVIMSSTEESQLEYATWYFGRYYEIFFVGDSFEATKHHTAVRYEYAQNWYKEWQQKHTSNTNGGTASNLLAAADKVAKYVEQYNYTYLGTGSVDYTFPIQNSSRRTLSCSSYIQEVFLQAGYTQFAGREKIWATANKSSALGYFTNNGVGATLLPNLNSLQPGDILQSGIIDKEHIILVYSVNGDKITTKGVPEVLNANNGFNGRVMTISELNSSNYYAIRITGN